MIRESKLVALVAVLLTLGIGSCEREGPAERAGEKVDHAVDTLKNGGKEPASDKLEDAANNAQDAAADATDAAKQAAEDAKKK